MKKIMPITNEKIDEFIDRTEITESIMDIIKNKMQKKDFFKVFSIYGMGGMGKSCLLNELESQINKLDSTYKLVKVSFEIEKDNQFLENLIKIATNYDKPCILFNYALLKYIEYVDIYQLNNKILNKINSNFLTDLADVMFQISNCTLDLKTINLPNLGIPSISDTLNIVGDIYNKIQNIPLRKEINQINHLDTKELSFNLPIYLAMDIDRYENEHSRNLIFIFDSYNPSKPYSESLEWLARFISNLHRGLFIITSREKLLWEDEEKDIKPYMLEAYPEKEIREYLCKCIDDEEIVNTIILSTECIPIYVDLAINIYKKELECNPENIIDKSIFKDREMLVARFINHLKPEWQEVIFNLAVIRIFNKDIFKHIVYCGHLSCPYADYDDIIYVSLIQYIENSESLIKLHDIFCKNVLKILPRNQITDNLNYYLDYILKRESYNNVHSISTLVTFLINIINIENDLGNTFNVPQEIIEKTLDLFFMVFETGVDFQPIKPNGHCNTDIADMLYFILAIQEKKNGIDKSSTYLKKISDIEHLGHHKKSYKIFSLYIESLAGDYCKLCNEINILNDELTNEEHMYWYYSEIKLDLADLKMMQGSFISAFDTIQALKNIDDNSIFSFYNYLQIQRIVGHIYRFNFLFSSAFREYKSVLESRECGISTQACIYTNLIETACYYDYEYVKDNFKKALDLVKRDKQIRNEAKLYYSKAISDMLNSIYKEAQQNITKSINLNEEDGYESGMLFAYMAQAYLDYSLFSEIKQTTSTKIDDLLKTNKVYPFFKLPLAIMQNNEQLINDLEKSYEWLNFEMTKQHCQEFLNKISKPI